MSKLRRIFETTTEISFISPQQEFGLYWNSFLESELGRIYQAIPWKEIIKSLKLKESRKGRKAYFRPQGKLALMFLKAYTDLSDRKLIENLNGNIHFQMFCDLNPEYGNLIDLRLLAK